MNKFDAFKQAYDDYPTQDNEGFIPDRGGFKCGFFSGWECREKEIEILKRPLSPREVDLDAYARISKEFLGEGLIITSKDNLDKLKAQNKKFRTALEAIEDEPNHMGIELADGLIETYGIKSWNIAHEALKEGGE